MTCIIVRNGAFEEYDFLRRAYGHLVPVTWDRRRASDTAPSAYDPDRRGQPSLSWAALGFAIVDRPAAWVRAAVSADEADHGLIAQAYALLVRGPALARLRYLTDSAANEMTPAQPAEAQQRAAEWQAAKAGRGRKIDFRRQPVFR